MALIVILLCCFSFSGYAQKNKEIIPVVECVKDLRNGLYQATFGYENPTKKEVVIDENGSIIKSNNGKKVAKGLNKFKPGLNKKTFTKEFGAGDFVEWTIISNGNEHTVIANANSAKCESDDGFIFPVIGNGKSTDLIGQELTAFCDNVIGDEPSDLIFQIEGEKILVEIIPIVGKLNDVINLLRTNEFNVLNEDYLLFDDDNPSLAPEDFLAGLSAIDVFMRTDVLCLLNKYPLLINFARPVYPAIKNTIGDGFTGGAVSQGDAAQTTDIVRKSFKLIDEVGNVLPVDGTGITIGVMSNSYDTQPSTGSNDSRATLDVKEGDLPGIENTHGYTDEVNVIKEYPYGEASDEGRAMMHIIHDVAPGAKLAFHTGSLSSRNFEVGFNALAVESDIIVDDITFITEPFFGEGRISEAINSFTDAGGIHFTSAGNFADNGYQSVFSASANVPVTNFIDTNGPTRAHLFDGSQDYLQKISVVEGTYMIALQWKEDVASQANETGAVTDLDIYIVDDNGRLLVGSNRVNDEGDPTEVIVFRATGSGEANILITSANGDTTVPFRYIAFQSNGLTIEQYNSGSPTVSGHAMTENSVTVGAIRYNQTTPELFSSFGGTLTDGNSVHVDFAAPDGVDTNVGSIGIKYFSNNAPTDGNSYPNFFGTSASAPSAAAAVALLQSALPTWYPDTDNPGKSSKSASEVITLFKQNVRDGSSIDPQAGAGMIDANKVFNSLASQTSRITSFEVVPESDWQNAGTTTVTIKIIGEFLPLPTSTTDPVVYLDGEPVPFTVSVDDDGKVTITAEIPPFSGNPNLQIYSKPKEGSEGNGGFSEPYKFFQDGKNVITVKANPVVVKFGEDYKSKMGFSVEGIALPENETSYATLLSNLGFPDIIFTTSVDNSDYPDEGNYGITPSFDVNSAFVDSDGDGIYDVYDQCPETPENGTVDSNGCSEAQKGVDNFTPATTYLVNFVNENLAIEKNYLTIKPSDQELIYGADIANNLTYQITDADGVPVPQSELDLRYKDIDHFYTFISDLHMDDFNPDYSSSLIFNDFKGLINDWDWSSETNDFKGLVNTWKALINDWKALINDQNFNLILEGSSWTSTENTFKGLVNNTDNINLDPVHFESYSTFINKDEPFINDFKPLVNDFKALVNRSEFAGDVYLNDFKPLVNDFKGLVNDFKPLVNDFKGLINESSALFVVISTDDAPTPEDPENAISTFYAVNLLTGIHVYEEPHYILPGSLINSIEANFEITYDPGRLTISPATLKVKTLNKEIEYGETLTSEDLTSDITGLVNNDLLREVFSNTIPYYFVKKDGDGSELEINELTALGEYEIKIRTPQNYLIEYDNDVEHGILTIKESLLTFNPTALTIEYGESPVIEPNFGAFAYEDDASILNNDDGKIPYYFVKVGGDGTPYTIGGTPKMGIGTYDIFVTDVDDNYSIVPVEDRGQLTVEAATLSFNPTALTVKYGKTPVIVPNFGAFAHDENASILYNDNGKIPYYFIKVGGDGTEYTIGGTSKMDTGTYDIFITDVDDNYSIVPVEGRGQLTVEAATLTFNPNALTIKYGETPVIEPNFGDFAYEDNVSILYNDNGKIPYYFIKVGGDGTEYGIVDKMGTGTYEIFITDVDDNYSISRLGSNNLTIAKATLVVNISPEELIVNQGETPALITTIVSGNAYDEEVEDVFGSVVSYEFVDDSGNTFYDTTIPGLFKVRISDPTNYAISYANESTLMVNPFNDDIRKVRTFADCVRYNGPNDYTVIFRYENDNDDVVFVELGPDNKLDGIVLEGSPPVFFMPGGGTFEIRFDGSQLTWSLTTYGSTNKTSISASNQSDTGECGAKIDGTSYTLYPNPVTDDELFVSQAEAQNVTVYVLDMYGRVLDTDDGFDGYNDTIRIDMSDANLYPVGMYIIKIVSTSEVKTYSLLKQ